MTQVFNVNGKVVPVTVIEAGPASVTQVKTDETDGYKAIQVGYGIKKKLTKPLKGHFKGLGNFRWAREYKVKSNEAEEKIPEIGSKIDVAIFSEGDKVTVRGISKGKGFQGVVKRHGFAGLPKTHGTKKKHRSPGSIGSRFPQHVRKGKRMAGHMGQDRVTIKKEVIKIDKANNLIALKGSIPGSRGSLVEIRG